MKMVLDARRRTKRSSLSSTNRLGGGTGFFVTELRVVQPDREEPKLSLVRQCALGISRSSLYYLPTDRLGVDGPIGT